MVTAFPDLALWALVMAGVTLIFWSLSHVLLQRYRAGTLSALWLLVAVAWLLPVRPASPWGGQATTVGLQLPTQEAGGLASGAPLVQIAAGVAVVGAVVALIRLVFQQRRFLTHVRRWGAVSQDPVLLAAVERAACDLGLKKVPTALEVPGIHTPMVFGVRGTKLLIPAHSPVPEDLVLRHELAHIKRRDTLIRLLLGLIQALQWWNPFVYLIVKNVRESSEIACDQRVLHGVPLGEREDYARSLLRAAVATTLRQPFCALRISPRK